MKKYRIKNITLLHDGVSRGAGEIIELTDVQAKKLADYVVLVSETETDAENAENTETKAEIDNKAAEKPAASKSNKSASKSKSTSKIKTAEKIAEAPAEDTPVIAENTEGGINGAKIV